MKSFLSNFIQKKYSRKIDERIPNPVLISFCIGKAVSLLRGIIQTHSKIFLEKKVILKYRKQIHFGKNLRLAENVKLDALSEDGICFGDNCSVGINTRIECTGSFSFLGKGFKCGNNCGLGTDSFYGCAGGIELGDDVIVGNFVSMHSENHNCSDTEIPIRLQGTTHKGIKIGNNVWIEAKVTILDGVHIGNGCVIGAGSVVTKSFPDNSVIAGVPAKIIKERI